MTEARTGEPGFGDDRDLVAWDRPETEPCQKGTPGCCVNHTPTRPRRVDRRAPIGSPREGPEQECHPW